MLSSQNEVVEVFLCTGLLEGENALHDDENNDGKGEQVNLGALILLALLDLWCHVGHCASVALEGINVLVAGEAKIGKLHVEALIEQNILELEVTVNDSLAV